MLYTIAVILLVLWILGLVTNYTIGGFIYVLLVAAIILFLIRIVRGGKSNKIKKESPAPRLQTDDRSARSGAFFFCSNPTSTGVCRENRTHLARSSGECSTIELSRHAISRLRISDFIAKVKIKKPLALPNSPSWGGKARGFFIFYFFTFSVIRFSSCLTVSTTNG